MKSPFSRLGVAVFFCAALACLSAQAPLAQVTMYSIGLNLEG